MNHLIVRYHGNYLPVGIFIMVIAALSLVAIAFASERRGQDLDGEPEPIEMVVVAGPTP